MAAKQLGFTDYEQSTAKMRTKREKFLAKIDKVVQSQPFTDLVQNWTSPIEPAVDDILIKVPTMHFLLG